MAVRQRQSANMASLRREDCWSALYYLLALPLAIVGAFAATGFTISTINAMPKSMTSAYWIGFAINILLPFLCGVAVYAGLAAWRRHKHVLTRGFAAHVLRVGLLYILATACGVILYRNWSTPDFGLWGQIPLWIGLVAAGGILADLTMSFRKQLVASNAR